MVGLPARNDPQVRRFCKLSGHLFPASCRVVVAVSGGADSVAAMHFLIASAQVPHHRLLVAHFDHNLRPGSSEDARFVLDEAGRLGLASVVEVWRPVVARVGNLAERARLARYRFLLRCAHGFGATCVVTGHHRDDQAETLVERLLRGSGVRGLGAMRATRPFFESESCGPSVALIRPLLPFSRAEIEGWLVRHALNWREDPSNRAPTARRNRIRHELLPRLAKVADGDVVQRLAETAGRAAQADAALTWMVQRLWPEWDPKPLGVGILSLNAIALMPLPDELLYRCFCRCHHQVTQHWHPPNARAVAGFIHLLRSRRRRWSMRARGLSVQRQQERLVFQSVGAVPAREGRE